MSFNYNTAKWNKMKEKILRMDGYVDQVELMLYGRKREANTVHHIFPVKSYPEYAFSPWNLISVSTGSHNKLENRRTGELTKLGKDLQQLTTPGIDWRASRRK